LCKLSNAVNVSTVETYFDNKKHSKPEIVNSTYRSIGVSSMSVSYTDGRLVCAFQRQIRNDSFGPKFFDLNRMYYLLVAKGPLKSSCNKLFSIHTNIYMLFLLSFCYDQMSRLIIMTTQDIVASKSISEKSTTNKLVTNYSLNYMVIIEQLTDCLLTTQLDNI
jgi:hypothetical protein